MKINKNMKNQSNKSETAHTFEGGKADKIDNFSLLKRSVLSTMLWEKTFYEDGESATNRIANLIPTINPNLVAGLAIRAREVYNLRHTPLFIATEMARYETHKHLVSNVLASVISRPDELAETLAIYWRDGKKPIANQIKKGLARAFSKFNEYSLAKYNQNNPIKLRDVLFLVHPKPQNKEQEKLWKRLANNELATPDTWEVELSTGKGLDKKESWERLLKENKLGAMALLRNLRNFRENKVDENLVISALKNMKAERVLPFRFIAASKYYPNIEGILEEAMFKSLKDHAKLNGRTALVLDVSGSMSMHTISNKSELTRLDAACALAILLRETCPNSRVFTFSKLGVEVPNRRGFALKDAIVNSQPNKDTLINPVIDMVNDGDFDRVIILTDGQIADNMQPVKSPNKFMINVANYKNGIGYKDGWTNIDGFSEYVVSYLIELQNINNE